MVIVTLIVIGIFFLALAALLAKRRRFIWSGLAIVVTIFCGFLVFWETTEISQDESRVIPIPTVSGSPITVR